MAVNVSLDRETSLRTINISLQDEGWADWLGWIRRTRKPSTVPRFGLSIFDFTLRTTVSELQVRWFLTFLQA